MHIRRYHRIPILFSCIFFVLFVLSLDVSAKGGQPSLSIKSAKLCIGESVQVKIKNLPAGAKVSFRSNRKTIASVTQKGQITGIRAGKATITATVKSKRYSRKMACSITVKAPAFTKKSYTVGTTEQLALPLKDKPLKGAKAVYKWSPDNKKVAMIKNGKVSGVAPGQTTVRLTIKANRASYQLKCTVKVKRSPDDPSIRIRKLDLGKWQKTFSYGSKAPTVTKKNGMLILKNPTANVCICEQTVLVKPNTNYRIRAQVRMEGYQKGGDNPGGATVGYGSRQDSSCYETDFVTSKNWTQSNIYFNSGNKSSITLHVANGIYFSDTRGTAYFRNIVLEELTENSTWHVQPLIYRNVDTASYKKSFSDAEIETLKELIGKLPDTIFRLSGGRMSLRLFDVQVIDKPIKSISNDYNYIGNLTVGPGKDINYDACLKGKDVNQVLVFAPMYGISQGWMGLGGTYYQYRKRNIFHCIIDRVPMGNPSVEVYGETYDARTAVIVHETLHCVETNSRVRGWSGFARLHDAENYDYNVHTDLQRLDWYHDLMQDTIRNGSVPVPGFTSDSFYVTHISE